jgi:hypothetical protein
LVTTSSARYEAERQLQLCRQNVEVCWRYVLQYLGAPFFIGVELDKRTFCAGPITDNGPDALPEPLRGVAIKLQDSFVGQPYAGAYLSCFMSDRTEPAGG